MSGRRGLLQSATAQARLLATLPAGGPLAGSVRAGDGQVAGLPALIARPLRRRSWPTALFLNGVTARGRHHPVVRRLALALAGAGVRVVVPDPPGLATGALSGDMLEALTAAAAELAGDPASRGGRVGLLGVSIGGTMALLVAEQPQLAERVSVVACLAPCTDFVNAVRLATTGVQLRDGHLVAYASGPLLAVVGAHSLLTVLPPGEERERLLATLPAVTEELPSGDPLAGLRRIDAGTLGPAAGPAVRLLQNRDPSRFDRRYRALPEEHRRDLERLSPLAGAGRLRAQVELVIGPGDPYFPLAEAEVMASASARVRVTVTPALAHADTDLRRLGASGLLQLDLLAVRILRGLAASPPAGLPG